MDRAQITFDWAQSWLADQIEKGRPFEEVRADFNRAGPLLISLANAFGAASEARSDLMALTD